MIPSYQYDAKVVRWVDGDTVDLRVDLGFYVWNESRFRLYGIDTPERGQPGYSEATEYCIAKAPVGSSVIAKTYKSPDKYGRFLADIYIDDWCLNVGLVAAGLAETYYGGTRYG